VAQVVTVLIMLSSCVVTYYQDTIAGAWTLLIALGAGTGSVFILRWFWWRINAWSEVSAMAASFVVSLAVAFGSGRSMDDPWLVLVTVASSTVVWLAITWLTAPEDRQVLLAFYRRVRPNATLWGPIAREAKDVIPVHDFRYNLLDWAAGCVFVYAALFGLGKIIFGETSLGLVLLAVSAAAGATIYWDLNRRGWRTVLE
jgi:hypothetical protein